MDKKTIIQEIKNRKEGISPSIYSAIFQNPYVRDLPDKAALRGMYSRFIVGENDVYFAFGYNKDMVYGDFIEARGAMIPESVVRKCGYFVPEMDTTDVIRLDCETRKLNGNIQKKLAIIFDLMKCMDFYTARCMRHHIPIPMYCYFSGVDDISSKFVSMLDNKAVANTATKQSFWAQEDLYLKYCAIPEWPIHPDSKRPGLLAFSASRYQINTTDLQKIYNLYYHPDNWNSCLYAYDATNPWISLTILSKEWADYIIKGLDSMKIPCRIQEDAQVARATKRENFFFRKLGLYNNFDETVNVAVNSSDYGAFVYWERKFISETYFSDAQLELGRQLYFTPQTAAYMFMVNVAMLKDVLRIMGDYNIQVGFPADYPGNLQEDSAVWLITEISNLPLVLDILNVLNTNDYHTHFYGMDFNSTSEIRRYAKMRYPAEHMQSLYVTSNEPCYKGKKVLSGRTLSIDGTMSEEDFTATIDPAQTPKSVPIETALESKLMIERPEWKD